MISYTNSEVVQCLRQYDMFANSLRLIRNPEERSMIVKQLTKLEEKIISLTNDAYMEEYNALVNKECSLIDEEKNRITSLIELINQRLSYVEKRCSNHYTLTGKTIDVMHVEGAESLDALESKLRIIDKYTQNTKLMNELQNDIKSLKSKISLASEKMDINKSLNNELEDAFINMIDKAFKKTGLYELKDIREEIEYAYSETENSLSLAELNLETARTSPVNILSDCEKMLREVKEDYVNYKDKMSLLKLMDIYDKKVDSYEELLDKRKEINEILKSVRNEEFLDMVSDTVSKQYSTIIMEGQDINTYNDLVSEKERKEDALDEIERENNSVEFKDVLDVLIENERKRQEKIEEEQRRLEEIEKQKKLELERKKQEEILKRQKIIEEARKKENAKRTKELLSEQQNSVLGGKKKEISFENIKDITEEEPVEEVKEEVVPEPVKEESIKEEPVIFEEKVEEPLFIEPVEEIPETKNKDDIEKELFEEFKSKVDTPNEYVTEEDDLFKKIDEKMSNNKLPDVDLDEYMKNFDESKADEETTNLFNDDDFPSIPV